MVSGVTSGLRVGDGVQVGGTVGESSRLREGAGEEESGQTGRQQKQNDHPSPPTEGAVAPCRAQGKETLSQTGLREPLRSSGSIRLRTRCSSQGVAFVVISSLFPEARPVLKGELNPPPTWPTSRNRGQAPPAGGASRVPEVSGWSLYFQASRTLSAISRRRGRFAVNPYSAWTMTYSALGRGRTQAIRVRKRTPLPDRVQFGPIPSHSGCRRQCGWWGEPLTGRR